MHLFSAQTVSHPGPEKQRLFANLPGARKRLREKVRKPLHTYRANPMRFRRIIELFGARQVGTLPALIQGMTRTTQATNTNRPEGQKGSVMEYAIANNLRGFRSSSLRVRVTDRRDGHVWVVTADLQDAGTPLVLREAQVEPEPTAEVAVVRHPAGLVGFEG